MNTNKKYGSQSDNNWISFSDIMTGLMVIFMFIAISYILEVEKEQEKRDDLFKDYKNTKEELYKELNKKFNKKFKVWDMELDKDLSIKCTNPDVFFESGKKDIRPYFAHILLEFLPEYFNIITQDKYKDKISEVRIEGHTDTVPVLRFDKDPYIGNILLSQQRSAEVLKYFRNMEYFKNLNNEKKELLQYWLTANGLSFGRTLDDSKQLTKLTKSKINNNFSRRVEFRIVTISDSLLQQMTKEIEK